MRAPVLFTSTSTNRGGLGVTINTDWGSSASDSGMLFENTRGVKYANATSLPITG